MGEVRIWYEKALTMTGPHLSWQNKEELENRELKKHFLCIMSLNSCPEIPWDYGIKHVT